MQILRLADAERSAPGSSSATRARALAGKGVAAVVVSALGCLLWDARARAERREPQEDGT